MPYYREYDTRVFITNGKVAWEIPKEGGIALKYADNYYAPPKNWNITIGLKGKWKQIPCGMFVRVVKDAKEKKQIYSTGTVVAYSQRII